jgi:Fic family protein
MTHLHVVSVHPFEDGNGRLARVAQSLVLARDGLVRAHGRGRNVHYRATDALRTALADD